MYLYLASPYSKYPAGLDAAYQMVCREHARLIRAGIPTFCPISHTHGPAVHGGIDPLAHNIWLPADEPFMHGAAALIMLMAESWKESYGMAYELGVFEGTGKPIFWMTPGKVPPEIGRWLRDAGGAPCDV